MNDEWSRCPICFEDYSSLHRPTTFVCGHSTCIDHTIGPQRLRICPICRYPLRDGRYQVSYNLEEASRLFQQIRSFIDESNMQLPTTSSYNNEKDNRQSPIRYDEIYTPQVPSEINTNVYTGIFLRPSQMLQRIRRIRHPRTQHNLATPIHRPTGYEKSCGHRCDLATTTHCCSCSDKREHSVHGTYPTYVDGRGRVNEATRSEFYCPNCKTQPYQNVSGASTCNAYTCKN